MIIDQLIMYELLHENMTNFQFIHVEKAVQIVHMIGGWWTYVLFFAW